MRALIVLCAAALAMGLGGCKKHDASDTGDTGSVAPPMEQPSQTPPPPEAMPAPSTEPSTEVPPAEETPPANTDSGETTPPSTESPPPSQ